MRQACAALAWVLFAAFGVTAEQDKKPPTEQQLTEWFIDLSGRPDPDKEPHQSDWWVPAEDRVLRGVFGFLDHPKEAVPFLRKKLKPADGPDSKAIDGWVKDLLGDDAKTRETADVQLRKHREDFVVLTKLLDAGRATESQPSRRRVVAVIQNEKLTEPKEGGAEPLPIEFRPSTLIQFRRQLTLGTRSGPPQARYFASDADSYDPFRYDLPRARRAFLVLERMGTPDAIDVLKMVAEGRAELPATAAAKEALERLKAK